MSREAAGRGTAQDAQRPANGQGAASRFAAPALLAPHAEVLGEAAGRGDDALPAEHSGYKTAAAAPGALAAVLRLFERSRDVVNQVNTTASERSRDHDID